MSKERYSPQVKKQQVTSELRLITIKYKDSIEYKRNNKLVKEYNNSII